jgi:hypothetical protein
MGRSDPGREVRDLEVRGNPLEVANRGEQSVKLVGPWSPDCRYGWTSSSVIVIVEVTAWWPDPASHSKMPLGKQRTAG